MRGVPPTGQPNIQLPRPPRPASRPTEFSGTRQAAAEAAKKVPMFRELLLSYSGVRICQEVIRDFVRSDEYAVTYASMDDLLDAARGSIFRPLSAGRATRFRRL